MRRWVILTVVVALLLAVAWWFFFISPRNARIAEAGDDLDAARQQESALRAQVAQLQAIRDAEVEYLAGIGQMEGLIPAQPRLDEFIDDLYALCDTTGVQLLNLSPAMPLAITGSELRQITVAATIDGDFFEVLGFLFGIMDMDRLVRVDAVAVSSGQDETGATTLSASLSLRLYTLADLVPLTPSPEEGGAGPAGEGTEEGETAPEAQAGVPAAASATTGPKAEG